MLVKPVVIDLGWGQLKAALVNIPDAGFVAPPKAAAQRQALVNQYVAAFRNVESAAYDEAKRALKSLAANISAWVATDSQAAAGMLVDGQMSKLS
jgi:hypothetical protein